jgi:hypothetical protein
VPISSREILPQPCNVSAKEMTREHSKVTSFIVNKLWVNFPSPKLSPGYA